MQWPLSVDPAFSHATIGLVDYVLCLHAIGQTTVLALPSVSMKTRQKHFRQFQLYIIYALVLI